MIGSKFKGQIGSGRVSSPALVSLLLDSGLGYKKLSPSLCGKHKVTASQFILSMMKPSVTSEGLSGLALIDLVGG